MTPELWSVSLLVLAGIVCWAVDRDRNKWKQRSQHWFSVAMGEKPMLNEGQACRLMTDLFPAGAPSVVSDVERLRAWRERRAVTSIDHTKRHFAEGTLPSEWATEVMQLTVGGWEVEGGE